LRKILKGIPMRLDIEAMNTKIKIIIYEINCEYTISKGDHRRGHEKEQADKSGQGIPGKGGGKATREQAHV